MGVDYRAAVWVGLPRCEIEDWDTVEELLDAEELSVCPPYYDGGGATMAIVGLEYDSSCDYSATQFDWDDAVVAGLKAQFKELTGQDAKVWLSPYGY